MLTLARSSMLIHRFMKLSLAACLTSGAHLVACSDSLTMQTHKGRQSLACHPAYLSREINALVYMLLKNDVRVEHVYLTCLNPEIHQKTEDVPGKCGFGLWCGSLTHRWLHAGREWRSCK